MNTAVETRFSAATRKITDPAAARLQAVARFGAPVATWFRDGDLLEGYGVAARWAFDGPDRFRLAAAAWRAAAAESGDLIAFGTFAFADASSASSVLLVPRHVVRVRRGAADVIDVAGGDDTDPADWTAAPGTPEAHMSPEAYTAAVAEAVSAIRSGALEKVVLARDVVLPGCGDLSAALDRLRSRHGDSWVFSIDGFFGASPETLVTVKGGTMTSRVLAGTAARSADPAEDDQARHALLDSAKNRFEHALAVDSLLVTLDGLVDGLVIGRPFALALPNVWHLATDATGGIATSTGALDLVAALHPTAAVAGSPKQAALDLIGALEPFDRGRYAGPVGWIDGTGDGEWAIGLRSAQQELGGVRAYAGAGIVAGSVPDEELAETGWKLTPILDALA